MAFENIMDYIKDQADRYDIKNLQFEQDILFNINRYTSATISKILNVSNVQIDSVLKIQMVCDSINKIYIEYNSTIKKIIMDAFEKYADMAYNNMTDLIVMGNELQKKQENVREMTSNDEYDDDTIEFIRDHAFELLTNQSTANINRIRAELGNMYLKNNVSKSAVRAMIEKILGTNRSKSEEIAQTELSRAYNYASIMRLNEYKKESGERTQKYWHGFAYSENTCNYCLERIGTVYDIDDDTESLPAHVRCRCIWLPVVGQWDKPPTKLLTKANMLNTGYSKDMIYQRIKNRLDIDYADYIPEDAAMDYIDGDRSEKVLNAISDARADYINDIKNSYNIAMENANIHMANEFNTQMKFWENLTAQAIADKNMVLLDKSMDAIQGVMVLPWSPEQLSKWNSLLSNINKYR